jgi:acetyl-CoA C-acetyltransferase
MERAASERAGLEPLGRLVAYSHAGVEPRYMGIGPVPAVERILRRTGLSVDDMDCIELNEAFAAQALAVSRDLNLPEERTNPNGRASPWATPLVPPAAS